MVDILRFEIKKPSEVYAPKAAAFTPTLKDVELITVIV